MSTASKTDIVLPGIGKGIILKEVVRSFLHTGNPSALLSSLLDGVSANIGECDRLEDRILLQQLATELSDMSQAWRKKEEEYYL